MPHSPCEGLPPSSQAHKWYAICLSFTSAFDGTKSAIEKSVVVKAHFERSAALAPDNATARHLLGMWAFEVANLSWAKRKVAAALFASPPTATFDEAHSHFAAAEKISPGFYPRNRLMLGKARLQLRDRRGARAWFEQTIDMPSDNDDDVKAIAEAKAQLAKM